MQVVCRPSAVCSAGRFRADGACPKCIRTSLQRIGRMIWRSKPARLRWGESNTVELRSIEDLEKLLSDLSRAARDCPFIVELTLANGDMLGVGLGRDTGIVAYVPRSRMPSYFHAAAATDPVADGGTVQFELAGEATEFERSQTVPIESAEQALRYFFESGRLAPFLTWVED